MKVFASDFDNTLFFHDKDKGYIRKEDIEKIESFQSKGNLFGLCTGRALFDVFFDAKNIIDFDFYILVSGALILDKHYHILHKAVIPFPVIRNMYWHFKTKYHYSPLFVTEDNFCCIQKKIFDVETKIYQSIDEMSHLEFIGISYVLDSLEASAAVCRELNEVFGHTMTGYQNSTSVDIVFKGNSKGTGIDFIKNHLKTNKIYGIGDSYNDLPMLRTVDVAFTFPSAPRPVREQTDYLVDGIAQALDIITEQKD